MKLGDGPARRERASTPSRERVLVFAEDPDLLRHVASAQASRIARQVSVPVEVLKRGPWRPLSESDGAVGTLIFDGVVEHEVRVMGRRACELLGPGDLLQPWQTNGEGASVPYESSWYVVTPTRVGLLDAEFARMAGGLPGVMAGLTCRSSSRSNSLLLQFALADLPFVKWRLQALFWHLADRWGRRARYAVVLPVKLSHRQLGGLVGAKRPTVTAALNELMRSRVIVRRPDHACVLYGDAPRRVADLLSCRELPELGPEPGGHELAAGLTRRAGERGGFLSDT